jgi:hypothetical protein
MRVAFLLSMVLAIAGCGGSAVSTEPPEPQDDGQRFVSHVFYRRDDRTGLCFAVYSPGMNNGAFTTVPCESVRAQLPSR